MREVGREKTKILIFIMSTCRWRCHCLVWDELAYMHIYGCLYWKVTIKFVCLVYCSVEVWLIFIFFFSSSLYLTCSRGEGILLRHSASHFRQILEALRDERWNSTPRFAPRYQSEVMNLLNIAFRVGIKLTTCCVKVTRLYFLFLMNIYRKILYI